ncbi:hypothetical protein FQR65_LT03345 [Abscondita terminalis]|nr:hypothetical protein FQR65_LT03345 [Abscondita terminalis]
MEFSQPINDYMLFGEHAITVVSPPNIPIKENKFDRTTSPIGTKFTEQKTTASSYYSQPMTTSSRVAASELNVKTMEPTKTTKKVFYITKKPLEATSSSVTSPTIATTTTEGTTERNKDITTSSQEIKTISPTKTDFLDTEQRTTYSTQTTSNLNTDENTIDFTISRESSTTAGVKTTTGYPSDEYFETTTKEVQTTEVPTTTASSTTEEPKSTVSLTTYTPIKTTMKKTTQVNTLTTNFPLETTAIDDNVFQFNFFGSSNTKPTVTTFTSYSTSSSSSDVDDIFGIPIKHIDTDKFQNIEDNAPKVIFSNFFLPSSMYYPTETTSNSVEVEYAEDNLNGTVDPITSQSYITSVSFEVNKKQKDNSTEPKPTETSAIHNTVVPSIQTPKEMRKQITQNSKILDSLTTSILTHAKYINHLNDEKNENTTARPKRYARNKNIKRTKKIKTRKRK